LEDLEEQGKPEEKKEQKNKRKENQVYWESFYHNLSQKEKEEWRRITTILIKTYDSDKTNMLHQRYKEILIENEE